MITAVKFTISYSDRFLPPKNDLLIHVLKIFEYCDRRAEAVIGMLLLIRKTVTVTADFLRTSP